MPLDKTCAVCGKPTTARLCVTHGLEFIQSPLTQMVIPHASDADMEMAFAAYMVLKRKAGPLAGKESK